MTSVQTIPARYQVIASSRADAPWITMVHGVSQDHRVFDRQVEAFREQYRLLLVDLPGHGLSSELPGPYGLREFASSIAGALQAAGIAQTHFWGTHIGAGAGLFQACQSPHVFSSLILEGPVFPGRVLPSVTEAIANVKHVAQQDGIEAAREVWWREGAWFSVMRARPKECRAAEQRAIIDDFTGRPWLDDGLAPSPFASIDDLLAQLEKPVLIMNGEHDVVEFVDAADALEAVLPNCRRAVIKEAGGFPLWEFPERVNQEVRRFLEDL